MAKLLNLMDPNLYWKHIRTASQALLSGGIVAFPTESVYGLGVCADNDSSINSLYKIKQRPIDKQFAIMISKPEDVTTYVKHIPPIAEKLISSFWPGPLTIIFVLDDNSTVGIRNPSNHIIKDLIDMVKSPIASTSANISGRAPATDAQQVISYFSDKIDIVLDGGPAEAGNHSTIVKIQNDTFDIIRHGVIEEERINRCLNESCISIRS